VLHSIYHEYSGQAMTMNAQPHTPQQDDCDAVRDLLPAYLLGTAAPDEIARLRAALPACLDSEVGAALRADAAALRAIDALLLESIAPIAPPPRVKDALFARLNAVPDAPPVPPVSTQPPIAPVPQARRRVPLWTAALAAALIATNAGWLFGWLSARDALEESQQQVSALLARQDRALAFMSNLGTERVSLQSTADGLQQLATLYWNPQTREAALVTDALPLPDAEQTYQLWLIEGEQPVSLGVFTPDPVSGWAWLVFDLSALTLPDAALGISLEPAGGSLQPTTPPLAVGAVRPA
jgi:anti-sigma-K factor RskA